MFIVVLFGVFGEWLFKLVEVGILVIDFFGDLWIYNLVVYEKWYKWKAVFEGMI